MTDCGLRGTGRDDPAPPFFMNTLTFAAVALRNPTT
jgi:hypothetical protein